MSPDELNKRFFKQGTRGYNITSKFYYKYCDLFLKTNFDSFNDFLHQVYLSISPINFSKDIKNDEAYIIGAIKLQCRAQLDKAVRKKKIIPESRLNNPGENEAESLTEKISSDDPNPQTLLEGEDIFNKINIFKMQLKVDELKIFNNLIDERTRNEISDETNWSLNTVDTKIRRLRIKLFYYLKNSGYTYKMFNKYETN